MPQGLTTSPLPVPSPRREGPRPADDVATAGPASSRSTALDVLRAVAVTLVIGRHLPPLPDLPGPVTAALGAWQQAGWIGVDLFFVLSGYLVSGLILSEFERHRSFSLRRFLLRRGFKIYPGFWLMIATTLAMRGVLYGTPFNGSGTAAELLFVQNYFLGLWNHTWSLAVEEHFYLGIGLLFLLLPRSGLHRFYEVFLAGAGLVLVVVLGLRFVTFATVPYAFETHLLPTHLRIDSLLFGVILRVAASRWGDRWARSLAHRAPLTLTLALGAILAVVAVPIEDSFFVNTLGFTLLYLGFGAILLLALHLEATRPDLLAGFVPRAVAAAGTYSYSIYLWHMPVLAWLWFFFLRRAPGLGSGPRFLILVPACFVVGWLAAKLVEMPALRLRDRLVPSRSRHHGLPTTT